MCKKLKEEKKKTTITITRRKTKKKEEIVDSETWRTHTLHYTTLHYKMYGCNWMTVYL